MCCNLTKLIHSLAHAPPPPPISPHTWEHAQLVFMCDGATGDLKSPSRMGGFLAIVWIPHEVSTCSVTRENHTQIELHTFPCVLLEWFSVPLPPMYRSGSYHAELSAICYCIKQYSPRHQALIATKMLPHRPLLGFDDHLSVVRDLLTKSPPDSKTLYHDHAFAVQAMGSTPAPVHMHYTPKEYNASDELTKIASTHMLHDIRTKKLITLAINRADYPTMQGKPFQDSAQACRF